MHVCINAIVLVCCYYLVFFVYVFFFFKQKTAYEMRISDWSSDVCSSDLVRTHSFPAQPPDLRHFALATRASRLLARSPCSAAPSIRFLSIGRSEERRVGKECVSTCRSRWSQYH